MRLLLAAYVALASLAAAPQASAQPVVEQSVTGTPGNWTIDFTVFNTLDAPFQVYHLGLMVDDTTLVNAPNSLSGAPWGYANTPYPNPVPGRPDIGYNVWYETFVQLGVLPGTSLGGFTLSSTATERPGYAPYYVFAYGGGQAYPNPEFNVPQYPGFAGIANPVPEPASAALAAFGVLALAGMRRRRA